MSDPSTIDEAIGELNRRYGQSLPRLADFAPDSVLHQLWSLPVILDPNPPAPMVYKACATTPYSFNGKVNGQLILYVTPEGEKPSALTPCPPPTP